MKKITITFAKVGAELRAYLREKGYSSFGLNTYTGAETRDELTNTLLEAMHHTDFVYTISEDTPQTHTHRLNRSIKTETNFSR